MEGRQLHRVEEEGLSRLEKLLAGCLEYDSLHYELIPNEGIRERLLSELFVCDLTEFYEACEIHSDNSEMNSPLVTSDETEPYDPLIYYLAETWTSLRTDGFLIREDPSLKTLWEFMPGKDYLNSRWTTQLHRTERMHTIYLAVRPDIQHHGLTALLLGEVIRYANQRKLIISLETHNPDNMPLYEHFGFKAFGVIEKYFALRQHCLVREAQEPGRGNKGQGKEIRGGERKQEARRGSKGQTVAGTSMTPSYDNNSRLVYSTIAKFC